MAGEGQFRSFVENMPGAVYRCAPTISMAIDEAHGGTIAVESAVGRGTTVRVTLPRFAAAAAAAA